MSTRVQGWLICDKDSILVRDGMYKAEIGWSNQPDGTLPPPSECVRIEVEVATQGNDPNYRIAALRAYEVDGEHEKTDREATLTARQKRLVKQYIDAEIPPYMLKMGGAMVAETFLGPLEDLAPSPRARKPSRPQIPNEQPLRFTCRECGRQDANAGIGGIALRSTIGYRCQDCGTMICNECQKRRVKDAGARAALPATLEHLGKSYAYEDWYGGECQYCATSYAMELVFGTGVVSDVGKAERSTVRVPTQGRVWWQFWK